MDYTIEDLVDGLRDPKFDYFNFMVNKFATQESVDPGILRAMLITESHLDPKARSKKGAVGLAQLMKKTAESVGVKDRTNPSESIEGGAKYLKRLFDRFGSIDNALAAYNMGPTKFSARARKNKKVPKQVKNYVSKVKGMAEMMDKPKPPVSLAKYITSGVNPAYRGQQVSNPDGTISSEKTRTFGIEDKFYNIPTLQNGLPISNDEAIRRFLAGILPAVGVADTEEEALALAEKRSKMLGEYPVLSEYLDYLNIQR